MTDVLKARGCVDRDRHTQRGPEGQTPRTPSTKGGQDPLKLPKPAGRPRQVLPPIPQKKPTLPSLAPQTPSFQNCREYISVALSHLVCAAWWGSRRTLVPPDSGSWFRYRVFCPRSHNQLISPTAGCPCWRWGSSPISSVPAGLANQLLGCQP